MGQINVSIYVLVILNQKRGNSFLLLVLDLHLKLDFLVLYKNEK